MGLLQYGGLDESQANQLCDKVLNMPAAANSSDIFKNFIDHIGID
jgi:hypothetical protein